MKVQQVSCQFAIYPPGQEEVGPPIEAAIEAVRRAGRGQGTLPLASASAEHRVEAMRRRADDGG